MSTNNNKSTQTGAAETKPYNPLDNVYFQYFCTDCGFSIEDILVKCKRCKDGGNVGKAYFPYLDKATDDDSFAF